MSRRFDFFYDLRMIPHGHARVVDRAQLSDILPPYWKDERVATPEEWFIKTGRGLGLEIRHVVDHGYFVVTHQCSDCAMYNPGKFGFEPRQS